MGSGPGRGLSDNCLGFVHNGRYLRAVKTEDVVQEEDRTFLAE